MTATPQYVKGPPGPDQLPQGAAKAANDSLAAGAQADAQGAQPLAGAGPSPAGQEAAAPGAAQDEQMTAQMLAMQSGMSTAGQPAPIPSQNSLDEMTAFHTAPDPRSSGFAAGRPQSPPPPRAAASLPYLQAAANEPDAPPALKLLLQHILYQQGNNG